MNKIALTSLIVVGLLVMALTPLLLIWAINTLFATSIAFTFFNWLAALVIIIIFSARVSTNNNG